MLQNFSQVDRRIIKSKAALKESLVKLMLEKSFRDITITEIVKEANLNRGTFYKNYQCKEEILEEIIEDVTNDLITSFRAPYQNKQIITVGSLTASAIKIFDHVTNHSTFYTLLVKSNPFPGFQIKICKILKDLNLQDFADITTNSKINREVLASYRAYAALGVIFEWVSEGFKYSSTYMAEQLVEILNSSQVNDIYEVNII
ncbi:TetR family transcriptional regulator [Bacillus oleivorans]|uniref:TetR family transcriptional regulator n=1 Tax=Bacillus oleivorans TaxID=1448271 RepID=A0A285D6L0_9BACI|nr:TetR-like C-terminal domain-containing protein [Bacillus oleivorans]SNX75439.1 TetR family transcriptional regulator [Bacillus oleivorans]